MSEKDDTKTPLEIAEQQSEQKWTDADRAVAELEKEGDKEEKDAD